MSMSGSNEKMTQLYGLIEEVDCTLAIIRFSAKLKKKKH